MYVFIGKLKYAEDYENEMIMIVLPEGSKEGDPVYAYWMWTNPVSDTANKLESPSSSISIASSDADGRIIMFTLQGYGYCWEIYAYIFEENSQLIVTIYHNGFQASIFEMRLEYALEADGCSIYTGVLNYPRYAVREMINLIVPEDLVIGKTICAYWQWSLTSDREEKDHARFIMTIDAVKQEKEGEKIILGFADRNGNHYRMDGTVDNGNDTSLMTLTLSDSDSINSTPFTVERSYPHLATNRLLTD